MYKLLIFLTITFMIQAQSNNYKNLTLEDCIRLALERNKQKEISLQAIKKSEAQLKQAKSAKYPQLEFASFAFLNDENFTFVQPPLKIELPPINMGTFSLPFSSIEIPPQKFSVAENKSILSDFSFVYPLYSGGKINSVIEQAKLGLSIAQKDLELTESEIKYNVKKTFYSVLMAQKVNNIFNDALIRFETTYKLTETLYNAGSENVNKLDYLKIKMAYETFKGLNETISSNLITALSALKFLIGIEQNDELTIVPEANQYDSSAVEKYLESELLNESNINMQKINNAIKVFEYKIREAKSDYYPSIALIGSYKRMDNSYKYGFSTKENQNIFSIGIGMKWSLFSGFRTDGKVEEIEAELFQLQNKKLYLNEGLNLQKEKLLNELKAAYIQVESAKKAMETASEYRELQLKAYMNDMGSVSDFIEAQLYESFLSAQYEYAQFNRICKILELEKIFGDIQ
ncbi:MAG: TolC family protein [Candidatus Anstonellales archaeon]